LVQGYRRAAAAAFILAAGYRERGRLKIDCILKVRKVFVSNKAAQIQYLADKLTNVKKGDNSHTAVVLLSYK